MVPPLRSPVPGPSRSALARARWPALVVAVGLAAASPFETRKALEHDQGVWGLGFSPDGKTLAAATGGYLGQPGGLTLWDLARGEPRARVEEDEGIRAVAFSPDGKTLATAEFDKGVKIRDAATAKVIRELEGHAQPVNAVAFSPDGKVVASASWDWSVKLWDAATGEEGKTLDGHEAQVYALAFGPDGKTVASAGGDKTVRIWDVATGKELRSFAGHDGVIDSLAYSPDGKTIASASWDKTVRLWEAATGKMLATLEGHSTSVLAVAFSPDGKTLASAGGSWGNEGDEPGPGEVKIWDLATRKELASFDDHRNVIFGVAFSPDGKVVASASWDKTIRLHDVPKVPATKGDPAKPPGQDRALLQPRTRSGNEIP